jgi:hypothetical protein
VKEGEKRRVSFGVRKESGDKATEIKTDDLDNLVILGALIGVQETLSGSGVGSLGDSSSAGSLKVRTHVVLKDTKENTFSERPLKAETVITYGVREGTGGSSNLGSHVGDGGET